MEEQDMLRRYVELAGGEQNVSFVGRLGTDRYLDMDVTVGEALAAADQFLSLSKSPQPVPAFFVAPV